MKSHCFGSKTVSQKCRDLLCTHATPVRTGVGISVHTEEGVYALCVHTGITYTGAHDCTTYGGTGHVPTILNMCTCYAHCVPQYVACAQGISGGLCHITMCHNKAFRPPLRFTTSPYTLPGADLSRQYCRWVVLCTTTMHTHSGATSAPLSLSWRLW